jgi:hypothetical protein
LVVAPKNFRALPRKIRSPTWATKGNQNFQSFKLKIENLLENARNVLGNDQFFLIIGLMVALDYTIEKNSRKSPKKFNLPKLFPTNEKNSIANYGN